MQAQALRLVKALLPALREAGRIELAYQAAGAKAQMKADKSPVTVADQEAERCLLAALGAACPDTPVIAEESVAAGHVPAFADRYFLVDPLDGTHEFVGGTAEFCINVGLIENGQPRFGVLYAPAKGEIYATLWDHDLHRLVAVGASLPPDADTVEPAWRRIVTRQPRPQGLVAVTSRSHKAPRTAEWLSRHGISDVQPMGSAIKFCRVAAGMADVYPRLGKTSEWDTAAGEAILNAAGGCVTTLDGAPLGYGKVADGFVNPPFVAWATRPRSATSAPD